MRDILFPRTAELGEIDNRYPRFIRQITPEDYRKVDIGT